VNIFTAIDVLAPPIRSTTGLVPSCGCTIARAAVIHPILLLSGSIRKSFNSEIGGPDVPRLLQIDPFQRKMPRLVAMALHR
jgi:hypothetical protein